MIWAILLVVIIILIFWIYFLDGWSLRKRNLRKEIKQLEGENEALRETNRTLRLSIGSASEGFSQPVGRASRLVEKLARVKEALKGSKSAGKIIEDKFDEEIGPALIQKLLSSEKAVSDPIKRRLAHEIFVGNIGREILNGLSEGKSLNDAIADAGVPLRVGREHARILKKTGYLDNRLNLTDWGYEAIEL